MVPPRRGSLSQPAGALGRLTIQPGAPSLPIARECTWSVPHDEALAAGQASVRAGRRLAGCRPAGSRLRPLARAQPVSCPDSGRVRVVGHGPHLAGFTADDLAKYRVGPALDAESRRSQ